MKMIVPSGNFPKGKSRPSGIDSVTDDASRPKWLCLRLANRFAICLCQPGRIVAAVSAGQGSREGVGIIVREC